MKKNILIKTFTALTAAAILLGLTGTKAFAAGLPYDSYNYDYREYIHFTPAAYIPDGNINVEKYLFNGEEVGKLLSPGDICVDEEGLIYIADTGNNRIVILNNRMDKVVDIISTFDNKGSEDSFNKPAGVCVSEAGELYIADSQNKRVVVLKKNHEFVRTVENPKSESLDDNFVFTPLRITVDYADRLYVIAQNMFEGIMVFESNGNFSSFFGTINVEISLWDKFWKRIATKEERSKQKLFIPTEFTGLDIDPDGFVYATNLDANGIQGVRRLNPRGADVIKKGANLNVGGDLQIAGITEYAGASQFTDVVYRGNGIYSCIDRRRGRVFTYDHEGNLLYIFGGLGSQSGTFKLPTAIEDIGGRIVVLDGTLCELVTFKVSEYGDLINRAVALRYDGDEAMAVGLWEQVLKLDENNELAHTGIGKAYLTAGDYKEAMRHLKLGMARDYYSVAYRRYRNEILRKNAGFFLTGASVLIIAAAVFVRIGRKKKGVVKDA